MTSGAVAITEIFILGRFVGRTSNFSTVDRPAVDSNVNNNVPAKP